MALSKFFPCLQFTLNDNVYKLDYSNNFLCDCFPNLSQYEGTLEELNITSTRVNYLPLQLFYCHGLKVLLASNNNIESIPEAVSELRMLQKLNMSRNFISNVPESIKCCKNLTHLDLSCNNLQKIPDAITCLISLQELLLNETYLEFLPANFGRLVNLRIIELRSNNLVSLPKSMRRLRNLIRLDIGCNDFTVLPEVIGDLKQLRELWFDLNKIRHFPSFLGKLRDLVHCESNGNCFMNIPIEVGDCSNLELLSISTNTLNTLSCSIGLLKSLVTLKCENNVLTDLPDSISMLESLEELDVRHNALQSLPNAIGLLRKLRYLFADENKLRSIPDEICSCSELSILSISRNLITELPSNLGRLHNLKVLNIVENNISSLPISALSLINIKSLWISCNQSKPLIPLQYADISKKSELTCFMLPQLTSNYQLLLKAQSNEKFPKIFSIQQESLDEQSVNTSAKKRISFAEIDTVLSTNKQRFIISSATNTNGNSAYHADNCAEAVSCSSSQSQVELKSTPLRDSLRRSPTPYPKELRSMAQFIHDNQKIYKSAYKYHCAKDLNCNKQRVNDIRNGKPNFRYNDLYQQNAPILNKDNLQSTSEIFPNINQFRLDVEGTQNTKILSEQMYTAQGECFEKNYGEISAKNILPDKCEILCAEIHCLNPNATMRNDIKKSSNKWLFGVHKNPRVLQVQVKWENGCDIAINFLPNREGIYVVSTSPGSDAAKILLPFDKLLEVDGTDLTCISLDYARHVLSRPRPIINIMLSR